MNQTLQLRDAHWDVLVAPASGGSLLRCEFDALPVLQPVEQPALTAHTSARACCFPMIPYSNRIEDSRFDFRDVPVRLTPNVRGSPHAMHGHGWLTRWLVTDRSDTHCTLSYERAPDAEWPWRYLGRQTFAIHDDGLRFSLEVVNLAGTPMPCGLGFHPFFPAAETPRLRLRARSVWDGAVHAFPRTRVTVPDDLDFSNGPRISERTGIDHCFEHCQGRASITYPDSMLRIVLESCADADRMIVYIPAGADYFCVEPVTHSVNAFNLPDPADAGLWTLEPGAARRITMSLQCTVIG
jgi:Galactose mutarotase and related enzymes